MLLVFIEHVSILECIILTHVQCAYIEMFKNSIRLMEKLALILLIVLLLSHSSPLLFLLQWFVSIRLKSFFKSFQSFRSMKTKSLPEIITKKICYLIVMFSIWKKKQKSPKTAPLIEMLLLFCGLMWHRYNCLKFQIVRCSVHEHTHKQSREMHSATLAKIKN